MNLIEAYPLPRTSYSQLSSYENCPYTFYCTYILGQRGDNKYVNLGSVWHEIAELQSKQLIANRPWELPQLVKKYKELYLNKERVKPANFIDKKDYISLYDKGLTALKNYYETYQDSKPLFVEKNFKLQLIEGIPPVTGFIDRIDGTLSDPSEWIVTDYKTGSNVKTKEFLRNDFQLAIYAQMVYKQYGAYPKVLQYYHPVPNKFQKAIHQGDGVYKYTNQRDPVVTFSVADSMIKVKSIVERICESVQTDTWIKETDKWGCANCFHKETCQPFNKNSWAGIVN